MTAYAAVVPAPASSGGTNTYAYQLTVTAVSWPVKIAKIESITVAGAPSNTTSGAIALSKFVGASVSGGSGAITPAPLREGGVAATATSRWGKLTWNGSTQTTTPLTISGGTETDYRWQSGTVPFSFDYQFAFDLIIKPGTSFLLSVPLIPGTANYYGGFSTGIIYFDELKLTPGF